jgi:hypothetical protein
VNWLTPALLRWCNPRLADFEREANTRTMIKAAWTAALVIVLVWPLLFWGKPASPGFKRTNDIQSRLQSRLLNDLPHRQELLW